MQRLLLESRPARMLVELLGAEREQAEQIIMARHYTRSIPSGKSHYLGYEDALVVWSIPANYNIGRFLCGWDASVWELARLWAPDGHRANLLTEAISAGVKWIIRRERPDAVVSYADPNVGHSGGVYRAASWLFHGQSDESRAYVDGGGQVIARRAFHSGGGAGMTKAEIEAAGYQEVQRAGKLRFVRPLNKRAAAAVRQSAG